MAAAIALCALAVSTISAADTAQVLSASDLAARLSALQQDGVSNVRLRMEVQQPPGTAKVALQLQIKQRRTKTSTEVVYQILWPKERKGEAVLLRKAGDRPATGSIFRPPDTLRTLDAEQMKEPLFGSDLTYEDIVENFFSWDSQTIVGTEIVDRVNCQILESKPGKGQRSSYGSVRTWVDPRRLVPLRVEKYTASGQLARRIDSTRVATDDIHRHIPANLTVRGRAQGSVTEMDGSKIKHDVTFADREFTPEGLK
jgi:outer membrane lipoprotein-sorting protein